MFCELLKSANNIDRSQLPGYMPRRWKARKVAIAA